MISQSRPHQENRGVHQMGVLGVLLPYRFGCGHPFQSALRNTFQSAKLEKDQKPEKAARSPANFSLDIILSEGIQEF